MKTTVWGESRFPARFLGGRDPGPGAGHPEQLPAYAPELNSDEGIWNYLKRVELKNLSCHDLSQLLTELRRAKERLRHKTHIIQACFKQPGLV